MSLWSRITGGKPAQKHTQDSPDQIRKQVAEGRAIILDVRSHKEYDEGHLRGVVFIPITEIKALPEGARELPGLDKGKIVYCH